MPTRSKRPRPLRKLRRGKESSVSVPEASCANICSPLGIRISATVNVSYWFHKWQGTLVGCVWVLRAATAFQSLAEKPHLLVELVLAARGKKHISKEDGPSDCIGRKQVWDVVGWRSY